jgi:hypothetical protein
MFSVDSNGKFHPEMLSLAEQSVAEEFAVEINSGRLSVQDAYRNFWSYEEDAKLWGLPQDQEWRALMPAWNPILLQMAGILDEDKAQELVDVVGESYVKANLVLSEESYNPFEQDYEFMLLLASKNELTKYNVGNKIIQKIFESKSRDKRKLILYLIDLKHADIRLTDLFKDKTIGYHVSRVMGLASIDGSISVKFLDDKRPCVREAAIYHLEQSRHYNSRLIGLLEDKESTIRRAAASALGKIAHYDPRLLDLLEDRDGNIRIAAADALMDLGHYDPKLLDLLRDKNQMNRWRAAMIIGDIGHYDPKLLDLLKDESVAAYAVEALGKIGHYDPRLLDLLRDKDEWVRGHTAGVLGMIGHYDPLIFVP